MASEDRRRGNTPLRPTSTLVIAPGVLSRSNGPEVVLLEPSSEQFFGLDRVGARIFELLRERRQLSELFDLLLDEYDIDRPTLESDVRTCVEEMVHANLLHVVA